MRYDGCIVGFHVAKNADAMRSAGARADRDASAPAVTSSDAFVGYRRSFAAQAGEGCVPGV